MVNAWSLAASILGGTFDKDYPIMKKKNKKATEKDWQEFWEEDGHSLTGNPAPASEDKFIYESPDGGKTVTKRKPFEAKKEVVQGDYYKDIPWSDVEDKRDTDLEWIEKSGGYEWTPGSPWPPSVPEDISDRDPEISVGLGNTAATNDDRYMADIDDMYSHYFNDSYVREPVEDRFSYFKYNEHVMLDHAKNYIASTYGSHYTGDKGTQTLDLIEGIGDAEAFCRSNAIKYLSRFGKKDGKNEKDILKAIHYCTLLYHFAGLHNDDSN
tara:strand:+ start:5311 stop:6114 length:804 start_codon:yes stop_codon:yes gene_type:complete